ncbi:MAG: hypothetical protein ACUZ77_12940 [Candidatus Brocadiales bacterium]
MAKKKVVKKAASKKTKEVLVVGSKVRDYIKDKDCMTSSELIGALNDKVYCLLNSAVERAQANGRKTVSAKDI